MELLFEKYTPQLTRKILNFKYTYWIKQKKKRKTRKKKLYKKSDRNHAKNEDTEHNKLDSIFCTHAYTFVEFIYVSGIWRDIRICHRSHFKVSKSRRWTRGKRYQRLQLSHTSIFDSNTWHLFCIFAITWIDFAFWNQVRIKRFRAARHHRCFGPTVRVIMSFICRNQVYEQCLLKPIEIIPLVNVP